MRTQFDQWVALLQPLWEQRYSQHRPLPAGKAQHTLLRPVYWLGNWQFACLGYYEPPRRILQCAVQAEPFPAWMQRLVKAIEKEIRHRFPASFVPRGWQLNTCLVNFYGSKLQNGKWIDVARVGEHRDFEPGPVASVSFGERALFQFVPRGVPDQQPVRSEWLDNQSLQIFGGPFWKDELLHRVLRVENKLKQTIGPSVDSLRDGFRTRRINLTFRYVPSEHVMSASQLSQTAQRDIASYIAQLGQHSKHFADAKRQMLVSG
jgi:DNA oxidative demethylase